jgi:hypothetical protein
MFRYVPRVIPTKIFVIGCGGTGSRLVPLLAQFIKTVTAGENPRGTVVDPRIYLCDFDRVENKNLTRQNFIQADVGKSKAEVLAQRYGRAYGVNIVPITKRVTPGQSGMAHNLFSDLDIAPTMPGENCLVIMCVDSAQARRDILTAWAYDRMRSSTYRNAPPVPSVCPVFIDAGNEDDFGQVRIFQRAVVEMSTSSARTLREKLPSMRPEVYDIHCLPMDTSFYENMRDNTGGSCADLDQTLAINALMATMIMGMVQNLYYFKPFTYNAMSISLSGGVSVQHLTAEYMLGLSETSDQTKFGETVKAFEASDVLSHYIDVNTATLRRMGLKKDGSPRQNSRATRRATSDVVQESVADPSTQEDSEAASLRLADADHEFPLWEEGTGIVIESDTLEPSPVIEEVSEETTSAARPRRNPVSGEFELSQDMRNVVREMAAGLMTGVTLSTVNVSPARGEAVAAETPVTPPPLRPGIVTAASGLAP